MRTTELTATHRHQRADWSQDSQTRANHTATKLLMEVTRVKQGVEESGGSMSDYIRGISGPVMRTQQKLTSPPAEIVVKCRRWMGLALMALGVIEFVVHWFLPYNGTVLATQTPIGPDSVGRVRQVPASQVVSRMYPQMNIAIGSFISGAILFTTMHFPVLRTLFFDQCVENLSYILHLQACFQSMIIVITILPLAGVVNVFELAFASVLTFSQFPRTSSPT